MGTEIYDQNNVPQRAAKGLRFRRKNKKARVILTILTVLIVLIIAALSAIPPLIMDGMVNKHVNFKRPFTAEEFGLTSNKLKLTTQDGLKIAAYEVTVSSPKAVVIILSGIQNPPVTAFFGHSAWLKKNGFATVLCEMRAHGESEGNVICVGYKEHLDVKAVVDYIKSKDEYRNVPIVVYGLSMGAATAINAFGEIPEIDGLMSMSAFSSWEDVFCDNMLGMGIPEAVCAIEKPFVKIYSGIKYGFKNTGISPKNEIKKMRQRPVFIYHSREDSQIPFSSYDRILKNAPGKVETWVKEGDNHFPTEYIVNPEKDARYSELVMGFLNEHFGK